jgi:hypothetical protein
MSGFTGPATAGVLVGGPGMTAHQAWAVDSGLADALARREAEPDPALLPFVPDYGDLEAGQ